MLMFPRTQYSETISYTSSLFESLVRLTTSWSLRSQATPGLSFQQPFIVSTLVIFNWRWTWKMPKISPKYQPDVELPQVPLMGKMSQDICQSTFYFSWSSFDNNVFEDSTQARYENLSNIPLRVYRLCHVKPDLSQPGAIFSSFSSLSEIPIFYELFLIFL